jgi:hypothetical protein
LRDWYLIVDPVVSDKEATTILKMANTTKMNIALNTFRQGLKALDNSSRQSLNFSSKQLIYMPRQVREFKWLLDNKVNIQLIFAIFSKINIFTPTGHHTNSWLLLHPVHH